MESSPAGAQRQVGQRQGASPRLSDLCAPPSPSSVVKQHSTGLGNLRAGQQASSHPLPPLKALKAPLPNLTRPCGTALGTLLPKI
jgi:hypothetical protein